MVKTNKYLDAEFMARFYEFDEKKQMYKIVEDASRLPNFWYFVGDSAICVEVSDTARPIAITYEINTVDKLVQWYDMMFGDHPDFL